MAFDQDLRRKPGVCLISSVTGVALSFGAAAGAVLHRRAFVVTGALASRLMQLVLQISV